MRERFEFRDFGMIDVFCHGVSLVGLSGERSKAGRTTPSRAHGWTLRPASSVGRRPAPDDPRSTRAARGYPTRCTSTSTPGDAPAAHRNASGRSKSDRRPCRVRPSQSVASSPSARALPSVASSSAANASSADGSRVTRFCEQCRSARFGEQIERVVCCRPVGAETDDHAAALHPFDVGEFRCRVSGSIAGSGLRERRLRSTASSSASSTCVRCTACRRGTSKPSVARGIRCGCGRGRGAPRQLHRPFRADACESAHRSRRRASAF